MGRPGIDEDFKSKGRRISMTDAEWNDLTAKAKAAGKSISRYIVEKLKLKG